MPRNEIISGMTLSEGLPAQPLTSDFVAQREVMRKEAQDALAHAAVQMKAQYNQTCESLHLTRGDLVFVSPASRIQHAGRPSQSQPAISWALPCDNEHSSPSLGQTLTQCNRTGAEDRMATHEQAAVRADIPRRR
jgi:hypothetical protein